MIENIEQQSQQQLLYTKVSPLQFLRHQDRAYQQNLRNQKKRIKKKANLAAHIQQNDNIFHLSPQRINRKAAQNILWDKNYKLKMTINELKEQNSSLKARLWNFEKEKRKMDKQIESWNLEKLFQTSRKKPYIDMATVSKVFADQDYEIVSNKITIAQLQKQLEGKQNTIEQLAQISRDQKSEISKMAYLISEEKYIFLKCLRQEMGRANKDEQCFENLFLKETQKQLQKKIAQNANESELLKKKNELKKKANQGHGSEFQNCMKQISNYMNVNQQQISKMKQMMRKVKLQEQENVKDLKKEVKGVQDLVTSQQCGIQDTMGVFIQKKILLWHKINQLKKKINGGLSGCEADMIKE